MSHNDSIRALLEIHRTQILIAKKQVPEGLGIPDAYAYALDVRMCPFFHTDDADAFEGGYRFSREFCEEVIKYCGKKWDAKEELTFYQLEDAFGRDNRMGLIFVLRYAHLDRRFDDKFFAGIAKNCPSEAHGITDDFNLREISVV